MSSWTLTLHTAAASSRSSRKMIRT